MRHITQGTYTITGRLDGAEEHGGYVGRLIIVLFVGFEVLPAHHTDFLTGGQPDGAQHGTQTGEAATVLAHQSQTLTQMHVVAGAEHRHIAKPFIAHNHGVFGAEYEDGFFEAGIEIT